MPDDDEPPVDADVMTPFLEARSAVANSPVVASRDPTVDEVAMYVTIWKAYHEVPEDRLLEIAEPARTPSTSSSPLASSRLQQCAAVNQQRSKVATAVPVSRMVVALVSVTLVNKP